MDPSFLRMYVNVPDAPDMDVVDSRAEAPNSASQLLAQGAGMCRCNGATFDVLKRCLLFVICSRLWVTLQSFEKLTDPTTLILCTVLGDLSRKKKFVTVGTLS